MPVLCGSAFKNKGVQPLLDAVVDYLPSPVDIPPTPGIDYKTEEPVVRRASDDEPLSVLAFKIMDDPFVGSLTFVPRLFGHAGTMVLNSIKDKRERVGRMLLMHANNREDIKEAFAGDIVALAGLKDTTTGDTLCDPDNPVILEKMDFPDPVIEIAIEPKTKADQEKLGVALVRLAQEDPSFRVSTDQETGQTILKGMGELHLEIKVDILEAHLQGRRQYRRAAGGLSRDAGSPVSDIDYTHKKQTGGSGQFARMKLVFEPLPPGSGFEFVDDVKGGSVPKEFIPGVEKGLKAQKESGLLAGFPVIDFKATLTDGDSHEVDSSALAFDIAARAAFRELAQQGRRKLLEPIMKVEVVTPEDYIGGVIGDLNAPRPGSGTGHARQRADRCDGPARQYVRLHQHAALDVAGARQLHDGIRSLRAGAASHRGRSQSQIRLRVRLRRDWHGQAEIRSQRSRTAMLGRSGTSITARRLRATSRTATSARSVTSTTARRR